MPQCVRKLQRQVAFSGMKRLQASFPFGFQAACDEASVRIDGALAPFRALGVDSIPRERKPGGECTERKVCPQESSGKRHKGTGEIWKRDQLHQDEYEVYKDKRDFENGRRTRAVWKDGRVKIVFE